MAAKKVKLRKHELSRKDKWPDMIDVVAETPAGKEYLLATVHVDCFDQLEAHDKFYHGASEVELWLSDERPPEVD